MGAIGSEMIYMNKNIRTHGWLVKKEDRDRNSFSVVNGGEYRIRDTEDQMDRLTSYYNGPIKVEVRGRVVDEEQEPSLIEVSDLWRSSAL